MLRVLNDRVFELSNKSCVVLRLKLIKQVKCECANVDCWLLTVDRDLLVLSSKLAKWKRSCKLELVVGSFKVGSRLLSNFPPSSRVESGLRRRTSLQVPKFESWLLHLVVELSLSNRTSLQVPELKVDFHTNFSSSSEVAKQNFPNCEVESWLLQELLFEFWSCETGLFFE